MMIAQQPNALTLRLERVIRAPRERVFDAWTNTSDLQKFLAPSAMTISHAIADPRVGGTFSATLVDPDGTQHVERGVYREIVPPARLVYTHAWVRDNGRSAEMTVETIVTVEFRDEQGTTRVVLTQTGFDEAARRDGHVVGWGETLDKLEQLCGGAPS